MAEAQGRHPWDDWGLDDEEAPEEDYRDKTLQWCSTAPTNEKLMFLKRFVSLLTTAELKHAKSTVMRTTRRENRLKAAASRTQLEEEDVVTSEESVAGSTSESPGDLEPELIVAPEGSWWKKYKNNIVALDCELVAVIADGKQPKAAEVCIVDLAGNIVLHEKFFQETGSFTVNGYTIPVNGYIESSLENPAYLDFETVRRKVIKMLSENLVIVCVGANDFECLRLNEGEYNYFDLQMHFLHRKVGERGGIVENGLSLQSLCLHFFDTDIHDGAHSALDDALYTMKLFRDIYVNLKTSNIGSMHNGDHDPCTEIKRVKKTKKYFKR